MEINKIYKGDAGEISRSVFPDEVFDSHVSDPPYGLKFMGKHWDYDVPSVEVFREMYRTLKPGGYILIACGTRTQHRMAVNIEDAGFEIRDNISYFYDGSHEVDGFLNSLTEEQQRAFAKITNEANPAIINWLYGSGFPKSLDISKAIDKQAGVEREVIGTRNPHRDNSVRSQRIYEGISGEGKNGLANKKCGGMVDITFPGGSESLQWEGWGTAMKPAQEFWTLARKPLSEKTVAENVIKHGTGGINIDGCRIGTNDKLGGGMVSMGRPKVSEGWDRPWMHDKEITDKKKIDSANSVLKAEELGRFPANVIFDELMGKELDKQTGILTSGAMTKAYEYQNNGFSLGKPTGSTKQIHESNVGGGSRFFYCAKSSNSERNKGLEGFKEVKYASGNQAKAELKRGNEDFNANTGKGQDERNNFNQVGSNKNHHPTVKPIELMRYLVKLITPKGGLTCDFYSGSGTTLIGAKLELINYVGIEREQEYVEIAEARVAAWNPEKYIEQTLF